MNPSHLTVTLMRVDIHKVTELILTRIIKKVRMEGLTYYYLKVLANSDLKIA